MTCADAQGGQPEVGEGHLEHEGCPVEADRGGHDVRDGEERDRHHRLLMPKAPTAHQRCQISSRPRGDEAWRPRTKAPTAGTRIQSKGKADGARRGWRCPWHQQRQHSGTESGTENCQIGVLLACATPLGRTLIDRRSYLPTSRTDERERWRRAGIGDEVSFETRVATAKAMVRRAISDQIPFRWLTADAAYGFSEGRRSELERAGVFPVMATTRHDTVVTRWAIDHLVHDLFPGRPRQKWKHRSCGAEPRAGVSTTGPASRPAPGTVPGAGSWPTASQFIHCSLAEIRRPIARLTGRRPVPVDHIPHWSTWGRRRQDQARLSHYKHRGRSS